ncbi:putative ribonuclease H-like domain-containing protein [Tanacetum coccineum]
MYVKSVFLYGKIEKEVYVCQLPGFEDPGFPDRVYKVEKALYRLHQAPRAWYETLSTYVLDNEFQRGKIDKTLFIKRYKCDILLVQVYVDDTIFGSTKKELCIKFKKLMHQKFQMSSMGELTFFLGLQVQKKKDGIFISQDKYVGEILKKFRFTKVKTANTPIETQKPLFKDEDGKEVDVYMYRSIIGSLMYLTSSRPDIMYLKGQPKLGLWYPKDSPFNLVAYTDSDYARASLDKNLQQELLQVAVENCFGFRINYLIMGTILCIPRQKLSMGKYQLQALVDGKKIIITESIVRRDLQLEYAEGVDYLRNATIFEQLTLMGKRKRKDSQIPQSSGPINNVADEAVNEEMYDSLERATTTASSLEAEQDIGNIDKTRSKATLNEPNPQGTSSGSGPRRQEAMGDTIVRTRFENVSKTSNDSLLVGVNTPRSDEDRQKLNELLEFCTKLQQRVLDMENTKTAQAHEITSLKLRVKKLERKGGSRTHKLKRLYKVGRSVRVISSDEASLGILDGDEVLAEPEVTIKDVNLSVDEVNLAQALAALKSTNVQEKANVVEESSKSITTTPTLTTTTAATTITAVSTRTRAKGLVIHKEEQATTPTVSSQQPSQVKAHDKGKGIMVEEPVKMKKKDQISLDEELAFKLLAEEEEEERLAREKAQREEEANIVSWDNVEVVPNKEEVAIDAIPLETKPPSIVDYKIHKEGKKTYYQIIKADGSSKMYLVFSHMLKSFDMEDLETLWKLVKAKHGSTMPEEGYERVLCGDLKIMFDPHVED